MVSPFSRGLSFWFPFPPENKLSRLSLLLGVPKGAGAQRW